ncbi:hypothetical protein XC49_18100 [Clostridioides difficile]|nr:hypothetical protein XC49_18100 [Clostridioides difficile]
MLLISSAQCAQFNPPNISSFLIDVLLDAFSLELICISRPGSVESIISIIFSIVVSSLKLSFIFTISFLFIKFKLEDLTSCSLETLLLISSAQCAQFNPPSINSFLIKLFASIYIHSSHLSFISFSNMI